MPKVQVWVEVSPERLRALEEEARRRGVPVETLVESTVNALLRDLEHDEALPDADCPSIPS